MLKTHLDLSPIHGDGADSPGLNDRDMKLQDFVDMAEAGRPVPQRLNVHASQGDERTRVKPLPLY